MIHKLYKPWHIILSQSYYNHEKNSQKMLGYMDVNNRTFFNQNITDK